MVHTTTHLLTAPLTFLSPARSPFQADVTQIILTSLESRVLQCNLTLKLAIAQYEQVQTQALFNLNAEFSRAMPIAPFQPELPIALTISLRPDLLPHLAEHWDNITTALPQLNLEQPEHDLFATDHWFVLQVRQETPSGEISYRTFWDYVSPSLLFQSEVPSEAIADGLVEFFQSWVENNLPEMTQAALSEVVKDFSQELEEQLSESDLETLTQDAIATIFSELIQGFERWTKGEPVAPVSQAQSLLQTVQTFFQQDGWDFRLLNQAQTLQLAFQGNHDRWTCYAQTNEVQQHFVFYSIAPITVPSEKRMAIAEFLCRVNDGMVIGNFEINFENGEIRYKTSIDVNGDRLTNALIKQLVYNNVLTMDQYLPGIKAVVEVGILPAVAIQVTLV